MSTPADPHAIESLVTEIIGLCADIHRAEYRLLTLIRKLDAIEGWKPEMPSCAHGLNATCGLDHRQRTFSCHTTEDGSLVFEGRLPAEQGAMLRLALERAMEWVYREGAPQVRDEPAAEGHTSRRRRSEEHPFKDVPYATRRADALAALAERFLGCPPAAEEGLSTADRYQVVVHASAESLVEHGLIDPADPPQMEDGPVVAQETVRRITCDSAIVRLIETGRGEPLDVGRKTRVISPALRRALKRRDKQCSYPGCTHSVHLDGHHCEHWADGGPTNLKNVVSLCRFHHRLVHEGGYFVVKDGDEFVFCRPDGSIVPPVDDSLQKSIARAQRDLTVVRLTSFVQEPRATYRLAGASHERMRHRTGVGRDAETDRRRPRETPHRLMSYRALLLSRL